MKKISRNKQKDTRPFAGLVTLKKLMIVPLSIFALIAYGANFMVTSAI